MSECIGECGRQVRPGALEDDDQEGMFSEAMTGRFLYCQECFDEAPPL